MLGKIGSWRHAVVGVVIGVLAALAGFGVIGGRAPERFDAKTIVVAREGERALRVTEYLDIDFGDDQRRGLIALIPDDFGAPTDIEVSAPTADDTLTVTPQVGYTEIRVGDPDITFTGQHRYVLEYTLPDAHYDSVEFAAEYGPGDHLEVDLVAAPGGVYDGDPETGRFEAIVTGYELSDTICDVGDLGDTGGCTLADAGDGTYRAVIEPLAENDGVTVGGTIEAFAEPVEIDEPPLPEQRDGGPNRGLVALGFVGLGLVGAVPVHRWARRRGRNEVFAGGATEAAFGEMPPPGTSDADAPPPVQLVADDDLGDLATIEFVPPEGLEPWEAHVLLTERCGDDAVEAWLSGLAGREAIEIDEADGNLVISSGPKRDELPSPDRELLDRMLGIDDPYTTGKYDKRFAGAWRGIHTSQVARIADSGWWKHLPPGAGLRPKVSGSPFGLIMVAMFFVIWSGSTVTAFAGVFGNWPLAIVLGLLLPALVAYFMYRTLLPSRSAQGSALALQAESFRRFLHASEGRHVEWAWSNGLLREYSAWAVALGEAEAWSTALAAANVAVPVGVTAPLILYGHRSAMHTARTAQSKSGSRGFGGGGGGFGGGGVGGGGGGGSRGSW